MTGFLTSFSKAALSVSCRRSMAMGMMLVFALTCILQTSPARCCERQQPSPKPVAPMSCCSHEEQPQEKPTHTPCDGRHSCPSACCGNSLPDSIVPVVLPLTFKSPTTTLCIWDEYSPSMPISATGISYRLWRPQDQLSHLRLHLQIKVLLC